MRAETDRSDLGLSVLPNGDAAHRCEAGWTGEDSEGRPVPCLVCKPHLRPASRGTGRTAWTVTR